VDIVSVFRSRPALRWLVPSAAAVMVIGGGAAAGTLVASADPALPERSAAQLLVDVQNANVAGFSGTIVESADLGLPSLPAITGGEGNADLTKLITGSNTARVWYAGQDKVRLAVLGTLGETDIIRNSTDVWVWRSSDNSASHRTIRSDTAAHKPTALPSGVPSTPQEAADAALAAIDPTTKVSTTGSAKVAGRDAYELVLAPRDTASLIGQVRLAIDAKQHIPLRVDVYAKNANNPAVRVAFTQISFAVPDAQQFQFNPPPGAKVTTEKPSSDVTEEAKPDAKAGAKLDPKTMSKLDPKTRARLEEKARVKPGETTAGKPSAATDEPTVVGQGWTSVLVAKMSANSSAANSGDKEAQQLAGVLNSLPKVSGSWGSGHLLTSSLFSALITDDGRILVGAVAPEKLYEAAGK
jgi:outer membrane lipoprotein-sorting protein